MLICILNYALPFFQKKQVLASMDAVLKASGSGPTRVVKTTVCRVASISLSDLRMI